MSTPPNALVMLSRGQTGSWAVETIKFSVLPATSFRMPWSTRCGTSWPWKALKHGHRCALR